MQQLCRDGVTLAYEDVGRGAPPVVLVHDPTDDHGDLAGLIARLRRGHRVVVPDLRGPSRGRRRGLAVLADDLAWLCYEAGVYRPVLVGQGLGGVISVEVARRHPSLPTAVIALASAPARADDSSRSPTEPALDESLGEFVDRLISTAVHDGPDEAALLDLVSWDGAAAIATCQAPVLCVEVDRLTDGASLPAEAAAQTPRPSVVDLLAAAIERLGAAALPDRLSS